MDDRMTTEKKLMLMRCQLLLQNAQGENSILVAKAKLRKSNRKVAKKCINTD
ncbi:hypothetical protein DPMN_117375 [Dreissena polymorpha]|uniref:Uncharacterized protein n=1 Tax=Dreissena polymorpha TaxID=45954 RepID=A0A9D4KQT1_DREPO|nr:hypothetical protein DPMN_117375 [Dreissena polymorpha]